MVFAVNRSRSLPGLIYQALRSSICHGNTISLDFHVYILAAWSQFARELGSGASTALFMKLRSRAIVMYTQYNKNPSAWNFRSPEPEVTCGTVAIIIRVVLLSPYLRIRAVSMSSIHYNQSHRVYINRRQQYISWFQTFAVIWILYIFFWVFSRRQIVVGRRFGTLYQFHLQRLGVQCGVYTVYPAFEDGTYTGFRNVGQLQFDAGEILKRKYTTIYLLNLKLKH